MRRKQLFAIILAGALAAGSAPAAVFAAESDVAAMSEEGTGDAGFEEAGSEDGSSDAETPVTDGGDAATDKTPADNTTTDGTPADDTTTDETPAADNTTTDKTPAAEDTTTDATPTEEAQTQEQTDENKEVDPQEGETPTETTGIELADADGNPILDQDGKAISYTTLEEAVAGAEAYSAAHPDAAVYIQLTESIELDKTITVSGKVNIRAAKDGVTISRKEDGTFTRTMFSVSGEGSWLQLFADGTPDSTLTVSGKCSEDGVVPADGAIVEVSDSAIFGLNQNVTLTENDYAAGGAAINCNNGTIVFTGGKVTGNTVGDKGAVYSNKDVSIEGDASVTENDGNKNITLDGSAKLIVTGALTGKSSFSHKGEKAGLEVIKAGKDASGKDVSKDVFTAAVKNISYENSSKYEYSTASNGLSVSLKEVKKDPEPEKPTSYTLSYKKDSLKWDHSDHNTVYATFSVTGNCEWTYFWVSSPATKAKINATYSSLKSKLKFTSVSANHSFTVTAKDAPEKDAILVALTRTNSAEKPKAIGVNPYKKDLLKNRASADKKDDNNNNNTQTARTHTVTDGARVEGLDGEIKFFSKRYVSFTAIGAGTEDSAPYVKGDERWIPVYWKFPGSDSTHTTWSIGGKNGKGIQPSKGASTQDFTIHVYCEKQIYNGSTWQDTDVVEYFTKKFTIASYTDEEEKQWLRDNGYITDDTDGDNDGSGDGSGNGSGAGGTDAELTATAAASAKDAGSKSKSAVSTADESPIGTMSVLAALSLLAGGYVVVRKRKKEEI